MAKNKWSSAVRGLARRRWWVQTAFLLAWLDPLMLRLHAVCSPVFHCYSCPWATFACPIGVLANFGALHLIPYAAIGTLVILGATFGTFVCGWACPFGFLQDLAHRIPTPKFTLPAWMGVCRYGVLVALVLAVPYWFGEGNALFICRLCPAGALEGAVPNMIRQASAGDAVSWPTAAKTTILVSFLAVMFFTWRPWCTLFCPLGAIYALFNKVSFLFLRFQPNRCQNCELCRNLCLDRKRPDQRVDGMRCVRCLECTRCRAVSVETILTHGE